MFDEEDDENTGVDYMVEMRATERLMNEIRTSGFRDGTQEFLQDEQLIQSGFDQSFKLFGKLGFLIGQIRALSSGLIKDSCFLAKLNDKLERIENFNYESKIEFIGDLDQPDLVLNLASVRETIENFEINLSKLRDVLFLNNGKSLNENLNNIIVPSEELVEDIDSNSENVKALNDLVESWNF